MVGDCANTMTESIKGPCRNLFSIILILVNVH